MSNSLVLMLSLIICISRLNNTLNKARHKKFQVSAAQEIAAEGDVKVSLKAHCVCNAQQ